MHLVMEPGKDIWVPPTGKSKGCYRTLAAQGFDSELQRCINQAKKGQAPWAPERGNWPSNDWCWGTPIALADVKMDQYQKGILNWEHLNGVIEPHHPRNPSAAPLNMKAEAKKYIGELMLEETMPAPWTDQPVIVWAKVDDVWKGVEYRMWSYQGREIPGPGITLTFPTGRRDHGYMAYDGLAREGEPGGERRFNHWVPTVQDPDIRGYMENYELPSSETDRPPPGDEKDPYWEEVDYTIEPSHDETDLVPSTQERTHAASVDGLVPEVSRSLAPLRGLQEADDEDTAVTGVVQTGLTTPGGTAQLSWMEWGELTQEILRGEKVMDVSQLTSIQEAITQGQIQLRLEAFETPGFAREIIDALIHARPRPPDGNGSGGGGGDDNDNDNDNNSNNNNGNDGTGRQKTPSFTGSTGRELSRIQIISILHRHCFGIPTLFSTPGSGFRVSVFPKHQR
ncbi:hypothetical protein V8F33_011787 [Rhypophila sp. PSN 637]